MLGVTRGGCPLLSVCWNKVWIRDQSQEPSALKQMSISPLTDFPTKFDYFQSNSEHLQTENMYKFNLAALVLITGFLLAPHEGI